MSPVTARLGLAALILGGLAACNFLVASLDDYGTTCQLGGEDNACGGCIQRECGAFLRPLCDPSSPTRDDQILGQAASCAKDPDLFDSWACKPFADAGAITTGTDQASRKESLRGCIDQRCIRPIDPGSGVGFCTRCSPQFEFQGTTFKFDDSQCGRCMHRECNADLVECCAEAKIDLASCAYEPRTLPGCAKAWEGDGGSSATSSYAKCLAKFSACMRKCEACKPR